MPLTTTIPTPAGSGPVVLACGKVSREWPDSAAALTWARDLLNDQAGGIDFLFALAILAAARKPATRGRPLTMDLTNPAALLSLG